MTLRFYMHALYMSDGKVSLKKQLFRAGFDAVLNKHCPHCGREYEIITDDWIMTDLNIKGSV